MDQDNKLDTLHKALGACKSAFYYSLLFSFIGNLMQLVVPMYSLQVLDRVISSGSLETLMMLTLVVLLALTCLTLIQAVRSSILIRLGGWLDKRLAPMLFAHGVANSANKRSLSSSQHFNDLGNIKNFITGAAMNSLLDAPWSIIFIIVLFFIHPFLGVLSIIGGVALFILAILNEILTKPAINAASEHSIKSTIYADTASRNAEAIEAMGMLSNVTSIWQEASRKAMLLQGKASSNASIISAITKFIRSGIQLAVTGVGAYFVLKNEMTVGGMIAAGILVGRALTPVETAITSWKGFVSARKSLDKLTKSLGESPVRLSGIDLPSPEGKINVENVFFAPIGSKKPTLTAISFALEAGDILAVIGPSASGKSTLAKLLVGVWKPASGNIRLDNADVYSWNRANFGQHVGYLPQDVELFAGTVKANIARMDENAKDEDIVKAAQEANVHELILHLPNGYDTEVGIDGTSLSAGQRQRIALARAFYGNPKFIVLDEPNANLDSDGDIALSDAIARARSRNITVVVISHRPSIMQVVDKVLVIKDGKVIEFGRRDEVLQKMRGDGPKLKAIEGSK